MKKTIMIISSIILLASFAHADKTKRIYIQKIEGKSISPLLLKQIRDIITVSITETYGSNYYIINDDDIKIMYKQAETVLSSSDNNDEQIIKEIAQTINSDIIIYGNVENSTNGQYAIILNKLIKNSVGFTKSNMIRYNFSIEEINFTIPEFAKQIIDKNYQLNYSNRPSIISYKIAVNDQILIKTDDKFILDLVTLVNERINQIDSQFDETMPTEALDEYNQLLNDINTKLTKYNQKEIQSIINTIKDRTDNCKIRMLNSHNTEGDAQYFSLNFFEAFKLYKKSLLIGSTIYNPKIKSDLIKIITKKIVQTIKTGETYLYNIVKSKLDQSQYKNLRNDESYIDDVIQAHDLIITSIFRNKKTIKLYNDYCQLLNQNGIESSPIVLENDRYLINNDAVIDINNQYELYNIENDLENEISIVKTFTVSNNKYVYLIEDPTTDSPYKNSILYNGKIFPIKTEYDLSSYSVVHNNLIVHKDYKGGLSTDFVFISLEGKLLKIFRNAFEAGFCNFKNQNYIIYYVITEIADSKLRIDYYDNNFQKITKAVRILNIYEHSYDFKKIRMLLETNEVEYKEFDF